MFYRIGYYCFWLFAYEPVFNNGTRDGFWKGWEEYNLTAPKFRKGWKKLFW